jgi:hypothetical protein
MRSASARHGRLRQRDLGCHSEPPSILLPGMQRCTRNDDWASNLGILWEQD